MELENKVALITGAKRIGLVVATALAHRGVDIALSYARSRAEAEAGAGAHRVPDRSQRAQRTVPCEPSEDEQHADAGQGADLPGEEGQAAIALPGRGAILRRRTAHHGADPHSLQPKTVAPVA